MANALLVFAAGVATALVIVVYIFGLRSTSPPPTKDDAVRKVLMLNMAPPPLAEAPAEYHAERPKERVAEGKEGTVVQCEGENGCEEFAFFRNPLQLRGFRWKPRAEGTVCGGVESYELRTFTHVNTNNPLVVRVPHGPGLYKVEVGVNDCENFAHSRPRVSLRTGGVVHDIIADETFDAAAPAVASRTVAITTPLVEIFDPRTPIQNAAVGTANESMTFAMSDDREARVKDVFYIYRNHAPEVTHTTYNIPKAQVEAVGDEMRAALRGGRVASEEEVRALTDEGLALCACGWMAEGGSKYPSVKGTVGGCGGGHVGLVSCGDNGLGGTGHSGVYVVAEGESRRDIARAMAARGYLVRFPHALGTVAPPGVANVVQPLRLAFVRLTLLHR